jgi:PAS domain S-box-containing protein
VLSSDIAADPRMAPGRERARSFGLRSSAVVPLSRGGEVVASFTVYARVPLFFDDEETALLHRLGEALSFGLEALHREELRRQADQELRATASLLEAGETLASFGSASWDPRSGHVRWSIGLSRLFGIAADKREGWPPIRAALGPAASDTLRNLSAEVLAAGERGESFTRDLTVDTAGEERVITFVAQSLHDESGELSLVIATVQDITERVAAEQELREARDVLAEAEARAVRLAEQRRRLVNEVLDAEERERASMSEWLHDDALQLLLAARQDLEEALDGNEEALRRARDHVTQASSRIRDLVADISPVSLDFGPLSATVASIIHRRLDGAAITIDLDLDPSVDTPHDRLVARAARELVTNVVKHASASSVRVTLRRAGDEVALTVEDDGIGFTPDLSSSVQSGHIGLGSLASRADALSGSLRLQSKPGGGTVAILHVPSS